MDLIKEDPKDPDNYRYVVIGTESGWLPTTDDDRAQRAIDEAAANAPEALKAIVADRRYRSEIGGCEWNGYPVATDRASQSKLMAEMLAIVSATRADPSIWKMADGQFVSLSNAEMQSLIMTVRAHVANAFQWEAGLVAMIDDGTIRKREDIPE